MPWVLRPRNVEHCGLARGRCAPLQNPQLPAPLPWQRAGGDGLSPNPLAGALMADRGTVVVAARVTLAEETPPSADRRRAPCWPTPDLRTMGIGPEQMTAHGFRAMARTILDEVLGFRADFIKHRLAHVVRDPSGRSYNRTPRGEPLVASGGSPGPAPPPNRRGHPDRSRSLTNRNPLWGSIRSPLRTRPWLLPRYRARASLGEAHASAPVLP